MNASETIKCYPNPTDGHVIIEYEKSLPQDAQFLIFNALGMQVKNISSNLNKKEMRIDVSSFPKGIYFLHLKNAAFEWSKKIVLK